MEHWIKRIYRDIFVYHVIKETSAMNYFPYDMHNDSKQVKPEKIMYCIATRGFLFALFLLFRHGNLF